MRNCKTELKTWIEKAVSGDRKALEFLLGEVQDKVFNLSLRILGSVEDAEDATQDILIRILTNLSSFRMDSSFSTWVYRLSVNFLINYKKSRFSHYHLDFDFYGNDIHFAQTDSTEEILNELDHEALATEELKISCTNVRKIREYIFKNAEKFLGIINHPDFCNTFQVLGNALKNVPKEYPSDSSVAEYLKYKSWYLEVPLNSEVFENKNAFVSFAAEKYARMKPLNDFLNKALVGFSMPQR